MMWSITWPVAFGKTNTASVMPMAQAKLGRRHSRVVAQVGENAEN